jgi:hypothetical protein
MSVNKAYKTVKQSKEKRVKMGPPINGMQFARIAIMNLEKITEDDVEGDEAFDSVKQWIENHTRTVTLFNPKAWWRKASPTERRTFFNYLRSHGQLKMSWLTHLFTDDEKEISDERKAMT